MATMAPDTATAAGEAAGLGREIRYCPRSRPGMVIGIVSTILGLLTAVLLIGISGSASTKSSDITFVSVLMSIFLGIGVLLLGLRYRTIKKRTAVHVFEHGMVYTSGAERRQIRYSDVASVDWIQGQYTWGWSVTGRDGTRIKVDPAWLVNVDNTLGWFVRQRLQDPSAPVPPRASVSGGGEVVFDHGGQSDSPLLGKGSIEVSDSGLRVSGARARTALPMIIACAVGVMGVVAAAIVMASLDIKLEGRGSGKLGLLIGIFAGIAPGALVYDVLRKRMRSRRIDVTVPWSGVVLTSVGDEVVGVTITTDELRGSLQLAAQDDGAAAALAGLARVCPRAEYGV